MIDLKVFERKQEMNTPEIDMCKCSKCENTFNVSDAIPDYGHHDGWEMPAYTEYLCPICEDGGCIDDFFPSKKSHLNFLRAKHWADVSATFCKVYKVKGRA